MINWILQKNLTKPQVLNQIKAALNGTDEVWEAIEIIPFTNEIPVIQNQNAFPICYGSTTFMLSAYADPILRKGVFFDPQRFNVQHYVEKWGDAVLNADGQLVEFGQVRSLSSSAEKKWFIRPNADSKTFNGQVIAFQKLLAWSQQICELQLPDFNATTKVWIAEPKAIEKEWRLFIVDDQIVAAARYLQHGQLAESQSDVPQAMLNFANQLIKKYRLADVYAMDIALATNEYKLIECNCFNGTGFYQHDVKSVVRAVNQFIKKQISNG